jgi:hypothetical protein
VGQPGLAWDQFPFERPGGFDQVLEDLEVHDHLLDVAAAILRAAVLVQRTVVQGRQRSVLKACCWRLWNCIGTN